MKDIIFVLNTMKKTFCAAVLAGAALMVACSGSQRNITMGSLSTFDSLSYAMGVDMARFLDFQGDVPFDTKQIDKGLEEAALGKASLTEEEVGTKLNEFFMHKRPERGRAIAKKRAEADSARLAGGDTTKMEWPKADPEMFESEEERAEISYAMGCNFGYSLSRNEQLPLQLVWLKEAMQNHRDNNLKMDAQATQAFLQDYFMVKIPARNLAASEEWLAKIEKKSGVQKTESGLLYRVEKPGDASLMPTDDRDVVKVHYVGRLRTGKVFDASKFEWRDKEQQKEFRQQRPDLFDENGKFAEPEEGIEFPLNRVIKGWTEGMKFIGKGGKITLWIPASLAYGTRGGGQTIGPNEALEFEVELLEVTPFATPEPAAPEADAEAAESAEAAE